MTSSNPIAGSEDFHPISKNVDTSSVDGLDPQDVHEETKSDILALASKVSFVVSGIATGVFALAATLAAAGLLGAAVGTPIGWAALGALGVGLAIMAVRHSCMEDPKSLELFKENLTYGLTSAAGTYFFILVLYVGGAGGVASCGSCCSGGGSTQKTNQK